MRGLLAQAHYIVDCTQRRPELERLVLWNGLYPNTFLLLNGCALCCSVLPLGLILSVGPVLCTGRLLGLARAVPSTCISLFSMSWLTRWLVADSLAD